MSLQIPIQKDIGEYDEKIVGKLTLRTLCCLALGFSAAVAVAAVLHLGLKVDVSAMTLPIMAAALPFWLAGFCKPYGLPFERFVPLLASHAFHILVVCFDPVAKPFVHVLRPHVRWVRDHHVVAPAQRLEFGLQARQLLCRKPAEDRLFACKGREVPWMHLEVFRIFVELSPNTTSAWFKIFPVK